MIYRAKNKSWLLSAAGLCLLLGVVLSSSVGSGVAWAADSDNASGSGAPSAPSPAVSAAIASYQQANSAYQTALQAYNASKNGSGQKVVQANFQEAQKAYARANQAYVQAVKAISASFAADMAAATKASKQGSRTAVGAEAKNQVNTTFSAAIAAATARRDAALAQLAPLGDQPTRPVVAPAAGAGQNNPPAGQNPAPSSGASTPAQPQPNPKPKPKPKP